MPGDVNRLMSMINQANLPYQVFEEAAVVVQPPVVAAPPEACVDFLTVAPVVTAKPATEVARPKPANEDACTGGLGFFGGYTAAKAETAPRGVLLSELFGRMASAGDAARAAS